MPMKVVILHNKVSRGAGKDEEDTLVQVDAVSEALSELGHFPVALAFSIDVAAAMEALEAVRPDLVFNLVESVEGTGRLIYLAPALLDHMRIPYTGANTEAVFLTSNKLVAKDCLMRCGLPTPPWITLRNDRGGDAVKHGRCIIKSVWEHASVGLDEDSVVPADDGDLLMGEMERRKSSLGGDCFAEAFIDGRELNLSLIGGPDGPELLPPAEIRFDRYPRDKLKVVGYRAKWESDSFEYHHTPRSFDFPREDASLLARLEDLARRCWDIFHLRGYARVDFRVDRSGAPWVLEVNANPCLSPDAGFYAAAMEAGLSYPDVVARIVEDAGCEIRRHGGPGSPRSAAGGKEAAQRVFNSSGMGGLQWREEVKPSDVESVRSITESSGFFSHEEVSVAVEIVEERLNKGIGSGYYFMFAEREGRVAGYTCFGPIACTRSSYDLYWIAVHDGERRHGLGKQLLERTEQRILEQGGTRIYVDTSSRAQYEPTRAFYKSRGYRVDAIMKDFYTPGDDKVVFVKEIGAPSTGRPDSLSE